MKKVFARLGGEIRHSLLVKWLGRGNIGEWLSASLICPQKSKPVHSSGAHLSLSRQNNLLNFHFSWLRQSLAICKGLRKTSILSLQRKTPYSGFFFFPCNIFLWQHRPFVVVLYLTLISLQGTKLRELALFPSFLWGKEKREKRRSQLYMGMEKIILSRTSKSSLLFTQQLAK